MKNCAWVSIDDFVSLSEFTRFEKWMDEQIARGEATAIAVTTPYLNAPSFKEKWFRHQGSGHVWRLVWPDGPFTGTFEAVTSTGVHLKAL